MGRQHRAGRRKGAEGESHTDSMTHTETVRSDRFAVSYIDVLPPTPCPSHRHSGTSHRRQRKNLCLSHQTPPPLGSLASLTIV